MELWISAINPRPGTNISLSFRVDFEVGIPDKSPCVLWRHEEKACVKVLTIKADKETLQE